jgi:hypothetical protein
MTSALLVVDKTYRDPRTAEEARLSRAAARARQCWYHAGAVALGRRRAAVPSSCAPSARARPRY